MKWINIFRAALLPLTLLCLLLGCILMLTGGAKFFSLDAGDVQRDGLTRQLDIFTDCGSKVAAQRGAVQRRINEPSTAPPAPAPVPAPINATSNATQSASFDVEDDLTRKPLQEGGGGGSSTEQIEAGSDVAGLMENRCHMAQRPYKWLLMWVGSAVGLTFLLLLWLLFSAPKGLLSWLAIHTAATIALMIVAIYVAMQLLSVTRDFADCTGFNQSSIAEINRQGFVCYNNPTRQSASRLIDHWATIFWVGVGFSLAGLGLVAFLLPLMQWAKERWGDPGSMWSRRGRGERYGDRDRYPADRGRAVDRDRDRDRDRGSGGRDYGGRPAATAATYGPSSYGPSTYGPSSYGPSSTAPSSYDRDRYPQSYDQRPGFVDRMLGRGGVDHTETRPDTQGGYHTSTTEYRTPGPIDRVLGRGDTQQQQQQQHTSYQDRDTGIMGSSGRDVRMEQRDTRPGVIDRVLGRDVGHGPSMATSGDAGHRVSVA